ncbi:hypothetical protein [Streptomyces sp. NPDC008150]|uniref:hypothetical protein n=1 Tax=Streptomyces sp. NPDC008150 TaxID=3364816 RepID=UPI0036E14C37
MGSRTLVLCAGLLTAAALAPTAYAADGGGVVVTPSEPGPGGGVALRVDGCGGRTGTAASAAFAADVRLTREHGALVGESRVRAGLTAGSYAVRVVCDGSAVRPSGRLTVGRAHGATPPPAAPSPHVPASPVAPVHAGGGGAAPVAAAEPRATGPGTAQAVVGLVLAGVAAVAVAVRSVRRGRGND